MNNKPAAEMILSQVYPDEVKVRMRMAYAALEYDRVLEIAAEHDISGRDELSGHIYTIPNPDFKGDPQEVAEKMVEDLTDEEVQELLAECVAGKEVSFEIDYEPPVVYKVKGVDDQTFKTAAAAAIVLREMRGERSSADDSRRFTSDHILEDESE